MLYIGRYNSEAIEWSGPNRFYDYLNVNKVQLPFFLLQYEEHVMYTIYKLHVYMIDENYMYIHDEGINNMC